jgi:hypothetical protein
MKRAITTAMLFLMCCAIGAMAQQAIMTTGKLHSDCKTSDQFTEMDRNRSTEEIMDAHYKDFSCLGYVTAILDVAALNPTVRIARNVTVEQLEALVVRYTADHPDDWSEPGAQTVFTLLFKNGFLVQQK